MVFIKRGAEHSESKAARVPLTAYLLDNLWLWALLAFAIALAYGAWAMIEGGSMHVPPGITPK